MYLWDTLLKLLNIEVIIMTKSLIWSQSNLVKAMWFSALCIMSYVETVKILWTLKINASLTPRVINKQLWCFFANWALNQRPHIEWSYVSWGWISKMIQHPTINRHHKSGRKPWGPSQFQWCEQHENRNSWSEPWQFTLILLESVVFQDNFHLPTFRSSAHLGILLQKFGSHWQPSNSVVKHLYLNQMCVFSMQNPGTGHSKWETDSYITK